MDQQRDLCPSIRRFAQSVSLGAGGGGLGASRGAQERLAGRRRWTHMMPASQSVSVPQTAHAPARCSAARHSPFTRALDTHSANNNVSTTRKIITPFIRWAKFASPRALPNQQVARGRPDADCRLPHKSSTQTCPKKYESWFLICLPVRDFIFR